MKLLFHAMTWAFFFGLISAPFGFAALYAVVALFLGMIASFLYIHTSGMKTNVLNYTLKEFLLLFTLTVVFWYPMYMSWFFLYILAYGAFSSLLR